MSKVYVSSVHIKNNSAKPLDTLDNLHIKKSRVNMLYITLLYITSGISIHLIY